MPASSRGSASAAATTNIAFGRPPLRAGARGTAGRLGHGVRDGSMPMTSRSGSAAAAASTYRPSPVPRSIDDPGVAGARVGDLADVHLVDARVPITMRMPGLPLRWTAIVRTGRPSTAASGASPTLRGDVRAARSARTSGRRRRSTRGIRATRDVARDVARLVASARPDRRSSSTSAARRCPGLPGKNFVDLGIEADPGRHPGRSATRCSRSASGGRAGVAPFPPTRPDAPGNVDHDGTSFRVHLHVMPPARARARRARRVPRRAARRPRAARRVRRGRSSGSSRRRPTARPTCCTRPTRAASCSDALYRLGIRKPPGRRRPSRCRRAPRSGSSAAASWAGCSRSRRARLGYRIVALDPDPDCPAASVADRDRRRRATTTSTPPGGWPRWPTS